MSSSTMLDLLAEANDKLAAEDLDGVPASCLGDDVVELAREHARLGAEILRRAARWDAGKGWSGQAATAAGWLAPRTGWSHPETNAKLRLARQLAELPSVAEALAAGELSETKAKVIAREVHAAADHLPPGDERTPGELFEPCAETIVDYAKAAGVRELGQVMEAFRDALDPDGGLADWNAKQARRRLHGSRTLDGMVRIDGLLDPEAGERFLSVLGQLENLLWQQDKAAEESVEGSVRTAEQRRADALGLMADLAREALDDLPEPGEPTDPEAEARRMRRQRGWEATVILDKRSDGDIHPGRFGGSGDPMTTATAQRLLCDAAVQFVLVGEGHPLYVGRKKRIATLAQIVALIVRDGDTCAVSDCPIPVRFTQAHHVHHWEHGGPTDLDNLVLLCHKHHHLVHEGGWRIEMIDGRPRFFLADGTPIEPERPPPDLRSLRVT
jgi:hypothetical protein